METAEGWPPHIDKGLFRAAHEGVPQGGVLSPPLLSNIMLNAFDQYLHDVTCQERPERIGGTAIKVSRRVAEPPALKTGNGN